jgi:penicillin-binding protein 1B
VEPWSNRIPAWLRKRPAWLRRPAWLARRPAWLPAGHARWFLFLLLVASGFVAYDWFRLSAIASSQYSGKGWTFPTRVYADWKEYRVGDPLDAATLQSALERARYKRIWGRPSDAGQYRIRGTFFEIRLRPFHYPDRPEPGTEVLADVREGKLVSLEQGFREPRGRGILRIDPELLGEFSSASRERRSYIPIDQIPRKVVLAVIASEDRRFYRHWGVDLLGLLRATVANMRAGSVVEGGSTISQQLAKNLFLSQERNMFRKFHEAFLALLIEVRYSKEQILEFYLNQIYLGQRGSWSVCGVEEAALFYFNKHAKELTLPEGAMIAGIIPAPNRLSPYRDRQAALERRDKVLGDMVDCGWISKEDARGYRRMPMRFAANPPPMTRAPYFVDYVRETLSKDIAPLDLNARGYSIFTTLDPEAQETAERSVREGAREADARSGRSDAWRDPAQAALVAIEPSSGYIRAMVGGRNYAESPFNRAVDSRRQPGSAFKPFVYVAALDTPYSGRRPPLTAATLLEDLPDTFRTSLGPWAPKNYENSYEGHVTAARALARSLNVATAHLSEMIGIGTVARTAHVLGIESRLREVASLALGTSEVTPLELTTAYAALANGGVWIRPIPVRAVLDRAGDEVWTPKKEIRRVLRPETAYMATILLEGPVIYGTAASIRNEYGFTRPAAGKTGTTDDENDAWFMGYTPDLVAGVWVGCDRNRRLGLTGTQAAVPIWVRFMEAAHRHLPVRDFIAPPGVVEVWIDAQTGYRAGPDCPRVMRVAFAAGTEPRVVCPAFHAPSLFDWELGDSTGGFDHGTDLEKEQGGEPPPPPAEESQPVPPPPPDEQDLPGSGGR